MTTTEKGRYIEGIGRRKTASARVRITPSAKTSFTINDGKDLATYFPVAELRRIIEEPFAKIIPDTAFSVSVRITGGGVRAQAEALRLGIARALLIHEETLRTKLKKAGFLKRDPRSKERRKFGLKKARKAPQWSKR